MLASSKSHPCPCCNRTRTNHCRFDLDGAAPIILCHSGISSGPPPNLRIGDTITFAGTVWALVATGKGHSGNSHEFRPHREQSYRSRRQRHRQQATQALHDLHRLDHDLADVEAMARRALSIPPLEEMLDEDIRTARATAEQAYDLSKDMLTRVTRAKRHDRSLLPVLERLSDMVRDLKYQARDLNRYCDNPAKYWAAFILNQPSTIPPEEPEKDSTDWEHWNTYDPNYQPSDPLTASLYDAHCKQRGWR